MSYASSLVPPVVDRRAEGGQHLFALLIDPGLPVLADHFPGDAILPGFIQVHWAIELAGAAFGAGIVGGFRGVEQLKFHEPVRPGDAVELRLQFERASGRLRFDYRCGGATRSAGTILLEALP